MEGYVTEYYVVSTIGHIRFLIVRVCQASDDIQVHYITLIRDVIQKAFLQK